LNYPGNYGFFFQFLISFVDLWVNETRTYWNGIPSKNKSFSLHSPDFDIFIETRMIINHTPKKMYPIRVDLFGFFGREMFFANFSMSTS